VDDDLLAALDAGRLAGAMLDAFTEEPLPQDHPYWTHPRVVVTPHIASLTAVQSAARNLAENIRRAVAGEPLLNAVDRARGY
jgi:glyoxylate/hydroxypyruvate reductase A